MKLQSIVIAAPSIQKLIDQDMPLRTAWELTRLLDTCNPVLEFYGAELAKMEDAADREARHRSLCELELPDFDKFKRVRLPLEMPLTLSAADVKRLEPFVDFKEGAATCLESEEKTR